MNYVSGRVDSLRGSDGRLYYIAAPFFNEPQLAFVREVESAFETCKRTAFSPRLQHGPKPTPIKDKQHARLLFSENYRAIEACHVMVAWVDWMLPEGHELRIVEEAPSPHLPKECFQPRSNPLNLPDTGTVWEMGAAFGLGKPIVMLTRRAMYERVNIMLSESCVGVAYGIDDLKHYLLGGSLESWEGAVQ